MYQYNSIMSAVNDFIDEVNESDSEAKLIKPHTIKEAYELLAGYYGKETGGELLKEYEAGRPHDVADATKLLLDVLKGKNNTLSIYSKSIYNRNYFHKGQNLSTKYTSDGTYIVKSDGSNSDCGFCTYFIAPIRYDYDTRKFKYTLELLQSYSNSHNNRGELGNNGIYKYDFAIGLVSSSDLGSSVGKFDAWASDHMFSNTHNYGVFKSYNALTDGAIEDFIDIKEEYYRQYCFIVVSAPGWSFELSNLRFV